MTARGERTRQSIGGLPLIDEDPDGARKHRATLLAGALASAAARVAWLRLVGPKPYGRA